MPYWLMEWIDNYGIRSLSQASAALKDRALLADFVGRAQAATASQMDAETYDDATLLAGRRIDLSCALDAYAWHLLRQRVDELFVKVWHYFDRILIVGADPEDFSEHSPEDEHFEQRALLYIQLILHLREIGAEPLVSFVRKPDAHDPSTVDPTLPNPLLDAEREAELVEWLNEVGSIRLLQHDCAKPDIEQHYHYTFDWPGVDHTQWGHILGDARRLPKEEVEAQVRRAVLRGYAGHLLSDIRAAVALRCPLGVGVDVHSRMLKTVAEPSVGDVAFQIALPFLGGITAREVIALRESERDAFVAFRTALRAAVKERQAASGRDAAALAAEIQRDIVEPALNDIARRLKTAERALAKKSALRIGIGALATACGVVTSMPLLTTAGVGTAMSALGQLDSFTDLKREAALSPMYYAWKAKSIA